MRSMALISGATGGLGKAFAVECASRGWDIALTDLNEERLRMLAAALSRTYGIKTVWYTADLMDPKSRTALFRQLSEHPARFHALFNIAGLDHEGMFHKRSREELQEIVTLNIDATLDVTHALLAKRDPAKTFNIITVASLAAFFPMPVKATYAASKRFLVDFSLALRDEVKPLGAIVTVLCPAGLPTTTSTIEGIEAQGFMGQLTTMNIGFVANRTVDKALAGRAIYVPGAINQTLRMLGSLIPASLLSAFVGHRWRAAQRRRNQDGGLATSPQVFFPDLSKKKLLPSEVSTPGC